MGQQYLTVKQFAARAGVSTQRIYQLLAKSLQEFCKVENGTKYISAEGLKVFDKEFLQEVAKDLPSDLPSGLQGLTKGETELLKETIEVLKQQLAVKDEQLATKDIQLSEKDKQLADLTSALRASQEQAAALTTALTAAQALHAATVQERIEERSATAEVVENAHSEVPEGDEPQQEQERRGFFSRIFGKRKKG